MLTNLKDIDISAKVWAGADVDYKRAAQSRGLALYHERTFHDSIDCYVLVLGIEGRGRGKNIPGHIDYC